MQDNASPCAMARTDFGATVEFKDSVLSLYRVAASFTDPATTAFQPGSSGACVPAGTSNLDVRNLTCVIQSVECRFSGAHSDTPGCSARNTADKRSFRSVCYGGWRGLLYPELTTLGPGCIKVVSCMEFIPLLPKNRRPVVIWTAK